MTEETKFCKYCQYYKAYWDYDKCAHPSHGRDPVIGRVIEMNCVWERGKEGTCGAAGTLFESKPPPEVVYVLEGVPAPAKPQGLKRWLAWLMPRKV